MCCEISAAALRAQSKMEAAYQSSGSPGDQRGQLGAGEGRVNCRPAAESIGDCCSAGRRRHEVEEATGARGMCTASCGDALKAQTPIKASDWCLCVCAHTRRRQVDYIIAYSALGHLPLRREQFN